MTTDTITVSLTPSKLSTLLAELFRVGAPSLITGAPGIGKSDCVAQAAEAAGADLILSHPAVSDPTDAKGLPWIAKDAKSATFLPFGELARAIGAKKPTVWFLDDLGQATPAVQASFMQLLLARRVNGHKLPDCVTFVAATNRRTDRAGVSGILEPVKSRFATIVELRADIDDWCTWALDNDLPPELVAFLRFRPNLLSAFEPTADLSNSPTPRTWAHAAKLMALDLPQQVRLSAIAGAVGQGAAVELLSFLQMVKDLPSIDAICLDPLGAPLPTDPSALYAISTGLAARATKTSFPRIAQYVDRLADAGHAEFAVLLVRDAQRRNEEIVHTGAYARMMSGPLGQIINGS